MAEFKPTYPDTHLDHPSLKLYGIAWDANDLRKSPCLQVKINKSGGVIGIYTNNPADGSQKPVNIPLSYRGLHTLLTAIEDCAREDDFERITIVSKDHTFVNRVRSQQPEVLGEFTVGRDGVGRVLLSVAIPGRKTCMFDFNTDRTIVINDATGAAAPAAAVSRREARSWTKALYPIIERLFNDRYKHYRPDPAAKSGGSNGGGNNGGKAWEAGGGDVYG